MTEASSQRSCSLMIVTTLLALAQLFSLLSGGWVVQFTFADWQAREFYDTLLFSVALLLLLNPGSRRLMICLSLLQIAHVAWAAPWVPNHRIVLFLINLLVVLTTTEQWWRKIPIELRSANMVATFARGSVGLLSIIYTFASLAKLNSGFLDTSISCATIFVKHIESVFPIPFGGVETNYLAAVYFSLVSELVLVILLVSKRTRVAGVILGVILHASFALDPVKRFFNFSSVMNLLLISCLLPRLNGITEIPYLKLFCRFSALAFVVTAYLGSITPKDTLALRYFLGVQQLWFLLTLAFVLILVMARSKAEGVIIPKFESSKFALTIVLFLTVLNGFAPYLGLKTRTGFGMYSNLRLENNFSNHLLVPRSADILGFLSDLVTPQWSDDSRFTEDYIKPCYQLTRFEFESYVRDNPTKKFRILESPQEITAKDLAILTVKDYLTRKLVVFRPVGSGTERICDW